jgi:amino acid adenylation domain-containing protein
MFTSGSTGVPKGVVISCGAVEHFLRIMNETYPLSPNDRVAVTAASSFDISVHNMFAAWYAGASVHIVPEAAALAPAKFIRTNQITCWFSVPSVAALMDRMHMLKPGSFPSLRQTLFCGEPLLSRVAAAWQAAAPESTVTNMYGPTEATVMCLKEDFAEGCAVTRDCIAIGRPFPGMKAGVITPETTWAADGEEGELLLAGPQLANGYLDDPERTRASFILFNGDTFYRTGDLARRDRNGTFHYLGRIDNQVKVLGYRVELEEIEFHLREVSGSKAVAAIAWPLTGASASGIVAFLAGFHGAAQEIKADMQKRLPSYMIPTRYHKISELPMNANGKVDRQTLRDILDQQRSTQLDTQPPSAG